MKEITSKRGKTDEDYAELARREWVGGLYFDPDHGIHIPDVNIWRCLYDSAKMFKLGEAFKRGVMISEPYNTLEHGGSTDPMALIEDANYRHFASIKVGKARIMRCRPHFPVWSTTTRGFRDEDQVNFDQLTQVIHNAGKLVGIGDWRPRFGLFEAELTKA